MPTDAERLEEYERSFRRAGLPLFSEDFSAAEDVFNRAVSLLGLVFLGEMLGAGNLDWSWWQNALAIAGLLKNEGYILDAQTSQEEGKPVLEIKLKYFEGRPAIESISRVSRSGLRIYRGKDELPKVLGGLGISIISTSAGLLTDAQARAKGLGGEVIGQVA